ncbi:DUF7522 family protein [Halostella litorea]|uniref:DUF7522 family protein n=1 Tax=Halostella litorea TaxID=2528831 RepID=UPI0010919F78|nr:hypothetical protein [Halostella litorea]
MGDLITDDFAEELTGACRAAVGDSLRAVVYFTPDDHEVAYVRSDLYGDDEELLHRVQSEFVESERLGFDSQETYRSLATQAGTEPELGQYGFTMRVFDRGYLSRVIVDDRGVFMTTDGLDIDGFRELAVTLRKLLAEPE